MAGADERRGIGHEARPRTGESCRAREVLSDQLGAVEQQSLFQKDVSGCCVRTDCTGTSVQAERQPETQ